jgi:hypothetical protein
LFELQQELQHLLAAVLCAGAGFLVGFTLLLNFFAFLALKYYSGQQARASVSAWLVQLCDAVHVMA